MTNEKNRTNFEFFEERLYDLLYDANLTPTGLSSKLGLNSSTISKCLNEKRIPSGKILIMIADYFDVSIDYLLGRSDYITPEVEALSIHAELNLDKEALTMLIANIKAFQEAASITVGEDYKTYTNKFFNSSLLYQLLCYGYITRCEKDVLLIMDSATSLFKNLKPFIMNNIKSKLLISTCNSNIISPKELIDDFCEKNISFIPAKDIEKLKITQSPTAVADILRISNSCLAKNLFSMYLSFFKNLTPEQITKFVKEYMYELYEACLKESDSNNPDTVIIDFEKFESLLK